MTVDPFQILLGVSESSDPLVLLDLWAEHSGPADIYIALYKRLVRLHEHEQGESKDAEIVRRRLYSAAKLISSTQHHRQDRDGNNESGLRHELFRKFLKTSEFADPIALLGLPTSPGTPASIDLALDDRLKMLEAHPESGSVDAEHLRQTLRAAAVLCKDKRYQQAFIAIRKRAAQADSQREGRSSTKTSVPLQTADLLTSPPGVTPFQEQLASLTRHEQTPVSRVATGPTPQSLGSSATLTPFDRQVLAVMVGYGGWNAESRSRLVALAGRYQVSPDGLVRVVKGLCDHARSHRSQISVSDIAAGMPAMIPDPNRPLMRNIPLSAASRVRPSSPLTEEPVIKASLWNTTSISLLFAAITIFFGLVAMAILAPDIFFTNRSQTINAPAGDLPEPDQSNSNLRDPGSEDRLTLNSRLARFLPRPTFIGNGLPKEGADAADQCLVLPEAFDLIERKLNVADDPSEAVFRDWEYHINLIATGWVLADASTRSAVEKSLLEVLYAASDRPSLCDRLLHALTPLSGKMPEPIDIWRGTWKTRMLARITGLDNMAPVVVEQAGRQLEATVKNYGLRTQDKPVDTARDWLDTLLNQFVQGLEYEPRAYDFWELWFSAQRELGRDDHYDESMLSAIEVILLTKVDLARPGPSVNVLGRLLEMSDYQQSMLVRDRTLGFFNSTAIDSRDLWVLTSLLATNRNVSWFTEELVLPDGADMLFRSRVRDRIHQRWPDISESHFDTQQAKGNFLRLNEAEVRWWVGLFDRLREGNLVSSDQGRMKRLLAASRLNEAFALLRQGKEKDAASVMKLVDQELKASWDDREASNTSSPIIKPGQPIGPDGNWATRYRSVKRDINQKLDLLSELASTAGTDLGPEDAGLLTREAYRGVPQEVRTQAGNVLVHRFSRGRNVVMQMINQFPEAPRNQAISDLISKLTGSLLPETDADSWKAQARMALVEHALRLHRSGENGIDPITEELIESMNARSSAMQLTFGSSRQPTTPTKAVELLVLMWREKARSLIVSVPVSDDLPGLHRRRLARLELVEGPIQRFVAEQISLGDLVAYVTVAESPELRREVLDILRGSMRRRTRLSHVLEQAYEIELAIASLHRLKLRSARARDERGKR